MNVTKDIRYIGVNDHEIDLFEGQYVVPLGMAYNSYVIIDEKIAVMDTVDKNFTDEWLGNLEAELNGRKPDYLVVQHMEPDHSANIVNFMVKYPDATIVSSSKAFPMMKNFFGQDFAERRIVVGEGDTLCLGTHTLTFVTAPMVHWPEVIVTYDSTDKVLFSADGFGKFGANDVEDPEGWACEARRYYFNICGKYGMQVTRLLEKASKLDIQTICPLHGPILKEDLGYYIGLYKTWAAYEVETEGVLVAYASIHGGTKAAAELMAEILKEKGAGKVAITDLSRDDQAEAVEDAFRMGRLVVAAASYDSSVFPPMYDFLHHLQLKGYQNRRVAIIENGSWAPTAGKVMRKMLEEMKGITIVEPVVTIVSRMHKGDDEKLKELADALLAE